MNKIWLIAKYEYLRHVKRKRFIFVVLSMPLIIVLMFGIGLLTAVLSSNNTPIGYVDHSGLFANPMMPEFDSPLPFTQPMQIIPYTTEDAAQTALMGKKIQAYFVISDQYLEEGNVLLVANQEPDSTVYREFREFLSVNLLKDIPQDIANRLLEGGQVAIRTTEDEQGMNADNIFAFILPFLAAFLFMIAVQTSGGYLLQAVVEEKENRTMEILLTSSSSNQIMTGKVIGNLSVGLTQLIIWIVFGMLGVMVLKFFIPEMQTPRIDLGFLGLMLLTFLPAFVMIAAMMATVGATATETREAQQIAGLFTLPIVIPFWFFGVLIESPNSPLAVGLSIFPFTAPVSLPLRAAFTTIPTWQTALTISLLFILAIASLWLAGGAFRLGMLRYGKKLSLKELFKKA
jgi:ABC-2 type transport system permease protein